jgi:hypothetical protein
MGPNLGKLGMEISENNNQQEPQRYEDSRHHCNSAQPLVRTNTVKTFGTLYCTMPTVFQYSFHAEILLKNAKSGPVAAFPTEVG